jgi:uncharacterized protein YggE
MTATVVVRGRGSVEVEPDAAVLVAEARARAIDPSAAHAAANGIASAVDELLDRAGTAVRRRSTSALLVTPSYVWRDNARQFVGFDAVRSSTIEIVDSGSIGDIFAGLASVRANAGSLRWLVDRDNRAHGEARRAAATDARERAASYAEALGVGLGPVLEIREPETRDHGGPHPEGRMYAMAADAGGGDSMEVTAPTLTVTAEVEVTFSITP